MPRVIHFEIHADDLGRASRFYAKVFGWTFRRWEGEEEYLLITTGDDSEPGINGGMMKRQDPSGAVYNTIEVPSLNEYIRKVEANGGVVVVPKMPVKGYGWFAYFKDTEGNIFGIFQRDPTVQ